MDGYILFEAAKAAEYQKGKTSISRCASRDDEIDGLQVAVERLRHNQQQSTVSCTYSQRREAMLEKKGFHAAEIEDECHALWNCTVLI